VKKGKALLKKLEAKKGLEPSEKNGLKRLVSHDIRMEAQLMVANERTFGGGGEMKLRDIFNKGLGEGDIFA
jgi:hypothetical protein